MIRNNIPEYAFGLWGECPSDVPVAWGARAIADRSGFSLLPDRQTWVTETDKNSAELINSFSKELNNGPLRRAAEECKKLRFGFDPIRDLSKEEFINYWISNPKHPEADPATLYERLMQERHEQDLWHEELESGVGLEDPDPPECCENDDDHGDICNQKFNYVNGEWVGCYKEDDAWVCESCGDFNYFETLYDEDIKCPDMPIHEMYRKIICYQGARMSDRTSETFTLFDDSKIIIKANTKGSYGYVYLIAYPGISYKI